jgi:D-alanyl-D-alanine-carboxypeptidase/D-alanyl-D-alanine-endopeptidase
MKRRTSTKVNGSQRALAAGLIMMLVGCGDGGSPAPSPSPAATLPPAIAPSPPIPPVVAAPDFSAVRSRIDQFAVNDVAVVIGNQSGVMFRYQRGAMTTTRPVFIASATKLLLGTTAWLLVEDRVLSPDTPVNSLLDFWSRDAADMRSRVTFGQLFAFTSGFNGTAEQQSCVGDANVSLRACVRQIHDGGLDSPPNQSFNYGNEHMQIAALAMVQSRGKTINAIMRERLLDRLNVSAETRYTVGAGDNPNYGGGMRSTGEDYGLVLAAILRGDIFADRTGFLTDRVASRPVATVPPAISQNRLAWYYGWGFWKECSGPTYTTACNSAPVISSAGAFGFTPWVDFNRGYWAVIVTEEPLNRGFDPAERSVALELELQPLIATALGR